MTSHSIAQRHLPEDQPVRLAGLLDRCGRLSPWRRRGLLAMLGALGAMALPPFNWVPLLIPAFVGLLLLMITAKRPRAAFGAGWWWGAGHFLVGNYWIANSFMIDAAHFGWMIPPVIGGLAAFLAIYPGLATLAAWRWRFRPLTLILTFAALWPITEWLRGHILTGYPWNLIAYTWSINDAMMQSAALWGSWGLGGFTVLLALLPLLFLTGPRRQALWVNLAGVLFLVAFWAGGQYRLGQASGATVPGVTLRLVQAAIPQDEKLSGINRGRHVDKHWNMTVETPGFRDVTAAIWPETAVNFLLERDPQLRAYLAGAVPPNGLLVTGDLRAEPLSGDIREIWNSVAALDSSGNVVATADKFHLVPLGEYVPLRNIFPFINKLTPGSLNFSRGPGPQTLHLPGLPPAGALICYEVIFPGAVTNATDRPAWLLNVTNDGWFGTSTGPYQHFVSARYRAVEEGLPLIRAANTGISGSVDPYGRVLASLPLGTAGILDVALPEKLQNMTTFARYGIVISVLFSLCAGLAAVGVSYWKTGINRPISQ
ncbi:apolipoprotein N-acyltransferase [Dongia soli]|uniref:Apolipoprotein N-acyltransferase n=1 Tax=Dongia soli TaxID=600628 RepID=A0ABU5E806_9PROT|nr:apolipoprotein N-acyltransferase [Dongia soli]MDY0882184.1 apolipoprotein N-acyltransferase [Dongia soli]